MSERNRQVLNELLTKEGNNLCADCRSSGKFLVHVNFIYKHHG